MVRKWLRQIDKFFARLEHRQGWARSPTRIKIHVHGVKGLGVNLNYAIREADRALAQFDIELAKLNALGHDVTRDKVLAEAKKRSLSSQMSAIEAISELVKMVQRGERMPWEESEEPPNPLSLGDRLYGAVEEIQQALRQREGESK